MPAKVALINCRLANHVEPRSRPQTIGSPRPLHGASRPPHTDSKWTLRGQDYSMVAIWLLVVPLGRVGATKEM